MPTTVHHEVEVKLVNGHPVPSIPSNMNLGETVHYYSKDGLVVILFLENGTPFVDGTGTEMSVITSSDPPLALSRRSTGLGFTCRCYLTPAGGSTVGWSPNYPAAGGNHVVH